MYLKKNGGGMPQLQPVSYDFFLNFSCVLQNEEIQYE